MDRLYQFTSTLASAPPTTQTTLAQIKRNGKQEWQGLSDHDTLLQRWVRLEKGNFMRPSGLWFEPSTTSPFWLLISLKCSSVPRKSRPPPPILAYLVGNPGSLSYKRLKCSSFAWTIAAENTGHPTIKVRSIYSNRVETSLLYHEQALERRQCAMA